MEYHGSRTQHYDRAPQFSLWGTQQYGKGPQSREPESWEDPQLKGQGVWGDPEPPEEWEPDPHPHDPENQFDIRDIFWDGWNPRGVQDQLPITALNSLWEQHHTDDAFRLLHPAVHEDIKQMLLAHLRHAEEQEAYRRPAGSGNGFPPLPFLNAAPQPADDPGAQAAARLQQHELARAEAERSDLDRRVREFQGRAEGKRPRVPDVPEHPYTPERSTRRRIDLEPPSGERKPAPQASQLSIRNSAHMDDTWNAS